jgi:hypothetical protein
MNSFFKLNLQNSYDKVRLLTFLQFTVILIAFIAEAFVNQYVLNFSFLFQFILLVVAFNFYYIALTNLHYSFWNISVIFGVYYVVALTRNFLVIGHPLIGVLFMLGLIFLLVSCYIISSPLYFPQVNWWEYDFRFRADVKCLVEVDEKQYQGRLSDLRRGAACLELFQNIPVGHKVLINIEILNQNFTLDAEIRSRREPIIGRTIIYGLKFIHNDLEQRQRMRLLSNYWSETKSVKIRDKFASIGK